MNDPCNCDDFSEGIIDPYTGRCNCKSVFTQSGVQRPEFMDIQTEIGEAKSKGLQLWQTIKPSYWYNRELEKILNFGGDVPQGGKPFTVWREDEIRNAVQRESITSLPPVFPVEWVGQSEVKQTEKPLTEAPKVDMPQKSASAGQRETQIAPNPPIVTVDTSGRDTYNFISLNWRLLLGGALAFLVFIAFDKDR